MNGSSAQGRLQGRLISPKKEIANASIEEMERFKAIHFSLSSLDQKI
jgi:hypothetical protein